LAREPSPPSRLPRPPASDPRVYFAAERTYLAWIRTGLALMGFGFVVARFGLFLEELATTQPGFKLRSSAFSLAVGTGLILIGVAVNVGSSVSYYRLIDRLNRDEANLGQHSRTALLTAASLALVGIAMAAYLTLVR